MLASGAKGLENVRGIKSKSVPPNVSSMGTASQIEVYGEGQKGQAQAQGRAEGGGWDLA